MSSNTLEAVLPSNPGPGGDGPPHFALLLTLLILKEIPIIPAGAVLTAVVIKQIVEVVKKNSSSFLGGVLTATGLAMLLPSLSVLLVNAIGFTAAGVVKGVSGL
jgi:hypothetical protein